MQILKSIFRRHPKICTYTNAIKLLVLLGILSIPIWGSFRFEFDDVKYFIEQNQSQAILISLLVYILFGFTFLPSIPLTLFIAALIGPLQAALVAALGNTIAALFEYQIGKAVGDAVAFEDFKSSLPLGLDTLPVDSPLLCLGHAVFLPAQEPSV